MNIPQPLIAYALDLYAHKDRFWLAVWLAGIAVVWVWNRLFLNDPAFVQIQAAFVNTCLIACLVILICVIMGWATAVGLYFLQRSGMQAATLALTFALNLIRSVPQIIGVLGGYVVITVMLREHIIRSDWTIMLLMAFVTALFVFLELVDLILERINHYKKLDFVNAMLCCGINESRIINLEILWKNSLIHIINKLIAIFGIAIFLQCSVDFIISVGLSTDVSAVNLPTTLGSMLAKIDSKQDILAIGHALGDPVYATNLFFRHLQGITTAFLLVFTLMAIYKISNGYTQRHRL